MSNRHFGLWAVLLAAGTVAATPSFAASQQQQQQSQQALPADAPADDGLCDVYGTGYQRVPGTDTCIKIGGHVQANVEAGNGAQNN